MKTKTTRACRKQKPMVRQPIPFQAGTVVRNRGSGNVYTVIANYGDRAVAVRECSIMNPSEWDVVSTPNARLDRQEEAR